jgi:hypothetical protein
MVVCWSQVEHPSRVCHSCRHIAPPQGLSGTGNRDFARKTAKRLVVHDDHLRRWGVRGRPRICGRLQPPFGISQPILHARELAAGQ